MTKSSLRITGVLCLAAATCVIQPLAQAQGVWPTAIACDSYARGYAEHASTQGQILFHTAGGTLLGFGIGAIAAASGVGAAIGATIGIISGGIHREQTADRIYAVAYQDCMAGHVRLVPVAVRWR